MTNYVVAVEREDNGVEMEAEKEEEEEDNEEKNEGFKVEEMKEQQEELGVMSTNDEDTDEEGNNLHDKD
eukprot:15333028-Ditylum_brightwellii.AAC.1